MFRNLANALIRQEQIVTTIQKAKEARRVVDRLVTLAKRGDLAARRLAFDRTRDREVVTKLFAELSGRYAKRAGGYTRVLRMSERRWGDAAEMAMIEMVDRPEIDRKKKPKVAAAEKAESEAAPAAEQKATTRFGKMFRGAGDRSKVKGSGETKAKRSPAKSASSRKVGTSGGKSGGSSSS